MTRTMTQRLRLGCWGLLGIYMRKTGYSASGKVTMIAQTLRDYSQCRFLLPGFQSTIVLSSNPAITLLLFQLFRRLFLQGKNRDHPTPFQAFVLGGLSNSIGSYLHPPTETRAQAKIELHVRFH